MTWIKLLFRKTYIIDVNLLPIEYKSASGNLSKEGIKQYENDFGIKIIPLDASDRNLQGNLSSLVFKKV